MALNATQRTEVRNILEMFRALKNSYGALNDKSGIDEWMITFMGFDRNSEARENHHLDYALTLVRSEFPEFKSAGNNLNSPGDLVSHLPMLGNYRKMLSRWNVSTNKHKLTREDLLWITAQ